MVTPLKNILQKRILLFICLTFLLALTLTIGFVKSVEAHSSSYCGHSSRSEGSYIVVFVAHSQQGSNHVHQYAHYWNSGGKAHGDVGKICNVTLN